MVAPRLRSKSAKRVATRTPAGRRSLRFKAKRPARLACRLCGAQLGGVKNARGLPKSAKVPSRMFAGELCGRCTSGLVSLKARIAQGAAKPEEARLAQQKYLRMMK
jgi:large subunit ribosomal protein L34e